MEEEPITIRIDQAIARTGLSRSTIYRLHLAGEIEIGKVGTTSLVYWDTLKAFLESKRANANRASTKRAA